MEPGLDVSHVLLCTVSQLGEGELDIAAGTLTVKGESSKTIVLLTVRAEFVFVHSGTCL